MPWQPASILYPDVEMVAASSLRSLLALHSETDVWVGRTFPKSRPRRAVQIVRDGGSTTNFRDIARLRILVWDITDAKVNELARLVVALVPCMVGTNGILRTEHLSGPYEVKDASPKAYLLFEIHFSGEALP